MACFLAPAAEAVITTVITKIAEKKEKSPKTVSVSLDGEHIEEANKIPFSHKLKWLNRLLWGGSFLLAFEHVWHGEVVPYFPFLTAAENAEDTAEMLHELGTVGVTMAVLITLVWVGMRLASSYIEKRAQKHAKKPAVAASRE